MDLDEGGFADVVFVCGAVATFPEVVLRWVWQKLSLPGIGTYPFWSECETRQTSIRMLGCANQHRMLASHVLCFF
jgi:hypothetical protein